MTHPVRVASRPVLTKRKALMISCASAAIAAVALAPQQARAQVAPAQGAFRGNMTVSAGTASQLRLTDSTETITIGSPTATINWSPTDVNGTGNVDFLPQGNVATFVNDPQLTSDYTVLNRIIPNDPARAIELNGHVLSQIQSGAGTSTGGKVWFYSPGGIVVGATAVFDVGGLLLSTIDLPNLFSADASGFSASFAKTQTTAGSIQVLNGAQINALQQNSYVALVAPRIVQGGNVQVNGSAAYAAGDQVSMTMNQGLFDIAIDVGTDDPEGIVHSGTTGGPASADNVGDPHRIYMVAVPKNQALTMLLGGSVGFDSATSASVENGAIVLSAGLSINENSTGIYVTHSSGTVAGIDIGAGSYTSRVEGYAKGDIEALADAGSIDFAGDVTLRSVSAGATGNIILAADYGYSLMIAGDATLYTSASTFASIIEAGVDGGTLTIDGNANFTAGQAVDGTAGSIYLHAYDYDTGEGILQGTLTVAGATYMYTNVGAASVNPDLPSADNVGGNVTLDAAGGTMTFADVTVNSSANGQDNLGNGDGSAGDGRGGNINFTAWSGGSITVDGSLNATADGYGGNMYDGGTLGGEGRGGDVHLNAYDGSIDITGDVTLSSLGIGGDYFGTGTPFAAQGGAGYGGNPSIWLDGPGSITVDGVINFYAAGTGGNGQTGGAGRGGIAGITSYDGSITLGPTINIDAAGVGGHASEGFGGNGGLGDGGTAYIEARGHEIDVEVPEATTSSITGGDATINANGIGGSGGASNGDNVAAGAGGEGRGGLYTGEDGTGGAFAASANGSSIVLGDVELSADGFGGDGGAGSGIVGGGAGGAAFGGSTEIGNYGPVGDPSGATYQNVIMYSGAFGGDGGTGGTGQGVGGEATAGGYVFDAGTQQNWGGALIDTLGTVTMGTAELYADATGGAGSIGGDAIGGIAQAASWQDTSSDLNLLGALTLDSGASGGDGVTGGSATGGYSGFGALTGARIDAALVTLKASATGGSGQSAGGVATGGSIEILSDGGIMNASNIVSEANAAGGDSLNGAGGNAAGDGGVLTASNGGEIHVIDRISMSADATGGNGGTIGGTATGGTLTTTVGGTITAGTLDQSVAGTGGDGSAGGDGTGGAIELLYGESGGSLALTGDWIFGESFEGGYGTGGDGTDGNGGTGTGATIDINVGPGGELDFATLWTFGMGLGGDSVSGIGGAGVGGTSTMTIASGGSVTGDEIYLFADAGGGNSVSGTGGSSDAGTALLSIDGGSLSASGYTLVTADSGAGSGADGGNANGGDATFEILANGGTVTGGTVQVSSQAIGGTGGATGTGGNGDGGTALFTIADALNAEANAAVTADITVIATGRGGGGAYGGSGSGGSTTAALGSGTTTGGIDALATGTGGAGSTDGGGGYGGEATITVGGNLVADHITAGAAGIGGAGTNGYGGEAWGSFARVEATGAGSIQATGGTIVNANGTGGAGMLGGGYGQGADASIWAIDGGSLVLGTSTTVSAVGTGGSSTNGTGGDGYGGYARVRAFDGSSITANALTVDTSGVGGNGVDGGTGQGGFDGEGSGGAHADSSGDLAGLTLTGLTTVKSNGSGGNATSGIGGSGYGGTADLGAQLGGDTVFASALIDSSGIGGSGSGGEGQGSGWDSTLSVVDGTLSGTSAIVQSNGTDTGGLAELESAGIGTGTSGDLNLGSVTMTANGGQSGGDVIVTVDYGSVADIGAASLTTSGPNGTGAVTIDVGSNASSVPFAGDLLFADSVTIDSTGSIDLISDNGAGMNAGSFDATAAGTISFDDQYFGATLTAPTITLQASDFAFGWSFDSASMGLTVDGNYNLSSLPYGADNLSVAATDNLIAGDLYASDSLALTAGGDLSVGYVSAGQDIAFSSSGNLTTGTLYAGGDIALDSAGNMTTGDLIAGGGVAAEAGGSMLVTSAVSGYDIPAESLGGVQTASAVVSGESVILDAAGDLTTGAIESAQDIVLTAGGDIDMSNLDAAQAISVAVGGSFSVAEVAGSSADFTAGNLAEFYGTVAVSTITVTSGGLYIADGASLGVSGITQLLTFNAVSDGPIFIGENNQEQPAGYALYSDGDIRSQSIVINAVAGDGATVPDVIFGDLMIEGSQTDGGGNSQVTLNTNGTIDVAGFVDFVNAGPADSMTLNAGDGIRIATGMGGISITDSSGDLAGMLVLSGDHIWVADQALISQLQSNPNFEGRDAALATNSGESVPNGFIRAGGVSATVVDSFLVQNSGTTDDLGGITVGDGGLTVTNGGTEPVTVIAYGRQVGSDGTTVDGAAFAGEVELGGAAGATSDSTINGCSLGSACGGAPPESGPVTGAESILGPIGLMNSPSDAGSNDSDDSDDEEESEDGGSGGDASNFLINTGPVRLETPINEPITSGSDSPVGLN